MSAVPSSTKPGYVTLEEYYRLDEASHQKLQYSRGRVFPHGCSPYTYDPAVDMAGGSLDHGTISANIGRFVGNRLVGKPCRAWGSDLRISAGDRTRHYPDASIICGTPEVDAGDKAGQTFTNPIVLFEVLSPSTMGYDLDDKFGHYRTIPTLCEYVLAHQDRPDVIVYVRQTDDTWTFRAYTGLAAEVPLESVGIVLPLTEIYDGITFDPPPTGLRESTP